MVVLRSHYVRTTFVEGAVIRVETSEGQSVTVPDTSATKIFVPAGRVTLHATVSPCDANCSHLDPPLRCTASFGLAAHSLASATVVVTDGLRCQIAWWASGGSGSAMVKTAKVAGLGSVLVNSRGHTLYVFAPDHAKTVTCTGQCVAVWHALRATSGKPTVSGGVKASLVSTLPNPSGGRVITYGEWPLYLYGGDPSAGTAHGQGIKNSGGLWYVIRPSGKIIKKPPGARPSTSK